MPPSIYFNCSSKSIKELFEQFGTSEKGLTTEDAEEKLEKYGYNEPPRRKRRVFIQFFSKFLNPLVIVLIIIGIFSLTLGDDLIGAIFVLGMVLLSVLLSFFQEFRSGKEAEKLSEMVRVTATAYRDGTQQEIKIRELVPGDVVYLSAGDIIPADVRMFSCKDLFINQSTLTGESFPVEKFPDSNPKNGKTDTELDNIAFMGSSVISGTGNALVITTGSNTKFGEISKRLLLINEETGFEKGIKKFTWIMIRLMIILVMVIFTINAVLKGNIIEAILFALAVAVGLTPEMLPMLVAVNLSQGSIRMSKQKVIVKRLNAIQNFGAMDILCTDKTGTLTMDEIVLEKHCDVIRRESADVLNYAYYNSYFQTGLKNLLDKAILNHREISTENCRKIDEIPFDFDRRVMSVVVEIEGKRKIIVKGAPEEIFARCDLFEMDDEILEIENLVLPDLKDEFDRLSSDGFRVLAVAYKNVEDKPAYSKEDEKDLVLMGYVAFLDPPKPSTKETIKALNSVGIEVMVLTGDNELVTKKICTEVGLEIKNLAVGSDIEKLNDEELQEMVKKTNIFARLNPLQKERIIRTLHKNKHIVGYLGDGINDAPALKAADVGISVNNGTDIAKESADIILLEKDLLVLENGVIEGRRTFGNIVKYIKMGASSNFGNMFSMTGASIFLPFLPMTPIQILLNNFLYDLSQTAIPTDTIDAEYLKQPRPWNVAYIKKFITYIGPISSIFDFVTFGVLYLIMKAPEDLFHTGWFLESLITQTLVIHIIRTNKIPFIESKPSKYLVITSLAIVMLGIIIPYLPLAEEIGFVHPPAIFFVYLTIIVILYLLLVNFVKKWFVKKYGYE